MENRYFGGMKHYDLCVIGAGPAGFAAAMRAMDLNKRVLMVEKEQLGGAGIRQGALSSKAFWEAAKQISSARIIARRCGSVLPEIPFLAVKAQVEKAQQAATAQLELAIEAVNQLHPTGHLDLLYGKAEIRGPHQVAVVRHDSIVHVSAQNILLATGSRPRVLPNVTVDEDCILSSDGIEMLTDYPSRLVVLGAGVIGCEFATIFALLGQTKVFLIDKADRILPCEDEDVALLVEEKLEELGVHIHRNAALNYMRRVGDEVEYELMFKDGSVEQFCVDKALVAVGRVPNVEGLGLENAGVRLTDRGHVISPQGDTCTDCNHIHAVGDLTADIALVNVAELEGRFAVEKMFGEKTHELCYENISTIMFLHPEVAGVGLNEAELRKRNIPYRAATVDYRSIPRAIAMGETTGFVKLLVRPDDGIILGMRAMGEHASSTIQAVALMIRNGIPVQALAELIHPHPSITEGVQECARAFSGTHIRKGSYVRTWEWKPS